MEQNNQVFYISALMEAGFRLQEPWVITNDRM